MQELFVKYKLVIKFILTFLIVYVGFSTLYHFYLEFSEGSKFYPDYLTHLVAKQTDVLLNGFGYDTQMFPHPEEASIKVILNGKYLARVIEGCNSVSVIILFMSFIIAFSGKLKTTLFFILSGSVLIYAANLIRIALFTIALYHYPERQAVLHDIVFPAVIYGFVFLLWIFWVNRFSNLKTAHE
ncbi:exosortase family protein XrtF [Jejuia spongiicola]|uniref:Exosortase family protein XrtF n=1 Tax=Jejuia spongiicola TaxID=2942207 RepID=A0ABT0QFB1_9FLAO|nr:exosortase family protein XrtF [Jejuia spongiicola]MCL6295691.1 exosortase family protein XrtF [Jejuia spongiicola]